MNIKTSDTFSQKKFELSQKRTRDNELKFIISNSKSSQVLSWLRKTCKKDTEYPVAMISSIYYDTHQWKYLNEKINSDYLKTKVRLRWYSDLDYRNHSEITFLEAKFKIGSKREKIRLNTSYTGEQIASTNLENPELINIPVALKEQSSVIKYPLLPTFQISYKRERFIDPLSGSRICFDYDISAPRTNIHMIPNTNHFQIETAVFEIKGNNDELPYSLYPLTDMGCVKSSFSKYLACYQKLMRVIS